MLKYLILKSFLFYPITVIEVATGEYGNEYLDRMIRTSENGRCLRWKPYGVHESENEEKSIIEQFEEEISPELLKASSTSWQQFRILHRRMTLQMWRDAVRHCTF